MSDDIADLDAVVLDHHWYVEGGGGRRFATKGEAIAYAWTLTTPGGVRPSVKMREDVVRPPASAPKHEVRVIVETGEDEVVWTDVGDILSASWRNPPTATIEITMPVPLGYGVDSGAFKNIVRAELESEAHSRGLQMISDVLYGDVISSGYGDILLKASARVRARD